jgi:RNA polymerase sigma-32 factor
VARGISAVGRTFYQEKALLGVFLQEEETAVIPAINANQSIDRYVAEINRYQLLTREEEMELARNYRDNSDLQAAHKLVVSNLRFVVKIAHEYRGYGLKLLDLIQEGNIGLMMAVKKFDPDKGYRLISYAVWWIRAYIQNFIIKSWSLVKLGTTQAQRKLFFKLRSERERDFSLDAELDEGARQTHLDLLADNGTSQEEKVADMEQRRLVRSKVQEAMEHLNIKERYIVQHRLMTDEPMTLQEIGQHFSISRERARQIEGNVIRKIRAVLVGTGLEPSPAAA